MVTAPSANRVTWLPKRHGPAGLALSVASVSQASAAIALGELRESASHAHTKSRSEYAYDFWGGLSKEGSALTNYNRCFYLLKRFITIT